MRKERKITFSPERFREAMSDVGITQVALAQKVGVSRSSIRRYMSGAPIPDRAVRVEICCALNVNIGWLMGRDEPKEREYISKHLDMLRSTVRALIKDDKLLEIAAALAEAPEQERRELAQMLGTPTDLELIEVRREVAKKPTTA